MDYYVVIETMRGEETEDYYRTYAEALNKYNSASGVAYKAIKHDEEHGTVTIISE